MEVWHVKIGVSANKALTEDLPFDLCERLEEFAAVMSVAQDLRAGSIALTVDAETLTEAFGAALEAVTDALRAEGAETAITSVLVQTQDDFQSELLEPVYPEVVGYAEIAKRAGVSRQRIRQLAGKPNFPRAVIRTGQGPLYSVHAIDRWIESRSVSNISTPQSKTA